MLGAGRFRVTGVAAEDDSAFRRVSDDVASGFASRVRPRRRRTRSRSNRDALASLRANTVTQATANGRTARQRARRRRAAHRHPGRSLATKSWCSCRASPTWIGRGRSSARRRSSSGSSSSEGPAPTREALLLAATGGVVPPGTEVAIGGRRRGGGRCPLVLPGPKRRGHHRTRYAQRAIDPGREPVSRRWRSR